ncbi:MAG: protein translocase subunit SecD [Acidimicrobiaceae bacterium]|mgnify:FL=1|jgi:preprotein translocase subunit SecD|nr:protein translocase subunit SecD [Acidimicrobiaceae bacterium]MBP7889667.1 protein translocase subunit SecD [Ilumatobacteraceae bacterium]HQY86234.1 protein translocase subunit SecD [Ilumatobacteraceae bacterium]
MRRKLILSLVLIMVLAYGTLLATVIGGLRPTLGLDLQGGVSVTQQPKAGTEFNSASLDLAVEKIRDRVDALGVAEPEILRQGDTIVVNLPGVENQDQAISLVQVTGQVYLRPVLTACFEVAPPDSGSTTTVAGTGSSTTLAVASADSVAPGPARPVSNGNTTTTEAGTSTTAAGTSTTEAAGDTSTTIAATATGATSTTVATNTTAAPLDDNGFPLQQSDPTASQYLPLTGTSQYCQVGPAQGTGEVFTDEVSAQVDPVQGWVVQAPLRGGAAGEDVWNNLAGQCYNREAACPTGQIAIELDGELQSVAEVQVPTFSGNVQISGSFSETDARNLAKVMNSGSLPVQLELVSVQNVSPTLGEDSLRAAWISGLVGIGLVLLFMIFYYRLLGVIVAIGLTVSGAILWSIVTLLSKTQGLALSLSGIAGIIVSVGVTVDSYVVFFERLKDEVRSGKTLRNSAQRGFAGAWRTIVIADLVSLIGAFVLWYLTVGAVRGFAFFLGLSTACDLVVSYFFTRPMVLLLARTQWMERRKVMGIEVTAAGGAS